MILKDLREFVNKLSIDIDDYEVVNGEVGLLDESDENSLHYRVDKPVIALYVDSYSKEICMFHQTKEDVKKSMKHE